MQHSQWHSESSSEPMVTRIRHELKRRNLTVAQTRNLTPEMMRIVFEGDELADFETLSPDDHVKLFIPTPDGQAARRDYTPRRFDRRALRLSIDFALHEAGPATQWARDAQIGDKLEIGGPRGSAVISRGVKRWLLVGDETGLPAIARRIEEAEIDVHLTSIVAISGAAAHQTFETQADAMAFWVERGNASRGDPSGLLAAVRQARIEPGTFVWIAAEAGVARAIRNFLLAERNHPQSWIKAAGYWVLGAPGSHEQLK